MRTYKRRLRRWSSVLVLVQFYAAAAFATGIGRTGNVIEDDGYASPEAIKATLVGAVVGSVLGAAYAKYKQIKGKEFAVGGGVVIGLFVGLLASPLLAIPMSMLASQNVFNQFDGQVPNSPQGALIGERAPVTSVKADIDAFLASAPSTSTTSASIEGKSATQTSPQNLKPSPQEIKIDKKAAADLEATARRIVIDYPFLDAPRGAEALEKIIARRDELIEGGTYPALALQRAANAIAPAYAEVLK